MDLLGTDFTNAEDSLENYSSRDLLKLIEMFENDICRSESPAARGNNGTEMEKDRLRELNILLEEIKLGLSFNRDGSGGEDDPRRSPSTPPNVLRNEIRNLLSEVRTRNSGPPSHDEGQARAKYRAYERRIRELNEDLSSERKRRKRAELLYREIIEDNKQLDLEKEEKSRALRTAKREIRDLRHRAEYLETQSSSVSKERERLQRSLDALREDMQEAHAIAKKSTMEAEHHRRRAISLEIKGVQDRKSQMALQLRVQELQRVQQEILDEMQKARSTPAIFSVDATKAKLEKLAKKRSQVMSRIAHLLLKKGKNNSEDSNTGSSSADGKSSRKSLDNPVDMEPRSGDGNNTTPAQDASPGGETVLRDPASSGSKDNSCNVRVSQYSESAGVSDYLNGTTSGARKRKLFKKKPRYRESLELTRQDVARHEQILHNIVHIKDIEIDHLVEELDAERMQNRGLIAELERERLCRGSTYVKGSDQGAEVAVQAAKQQLNYNPGARASGTLFNWREDQQE